jgi:pimeloyl-ACP methyl ester carboxylesterase
METTKSADGTVIAYDRAGDGPPLIVAVGAFCDRKTFVPPAGLTEKFTVYTYDRRGRGDSGDTQPYSPDREIDDLAAVVEVAGPGAFVYGHSSGAALALHAAARGVPLAAIVAYEAPYVIPGTRELAHDPASRIRQMVSSGRRSDAVRFWMTDVVQAPEQVVTMMERSPMWPGLEALTHTLPYDIALTGDRGVPADTLAKITVPVLVLGGGNSPDWFKRTVEVTAAAIPGARLSMLDGQDHGVPAEVISPILAGFFLGSGSLSPKDLASGGPFAHGLLSRISCAYDSSGQAGHRRGCGGRA